MAAPTTENLLAERLYALGEEVAELRDACYAPPSGADATQKAFFKNAYHHLKRFYRDAFASTDSGRGLRAAGEVQYASTFNTRNATERAAAYVSQLATTMTSTAAATVITAALTGQNQTQAVATINVATDAHPNAANIGDIAVV